MGTEADGVDFVIELVGDVVIDKVFGKDATFGQELTVMSQRTQRTFQGTRSRGNLTQFFRAEFVDIYVESFARLNFVLNPIEPAISIAANPR